MNVVIRWVTFLEIQMIYDDDSRRRNIRLRLFAGISIFSASSNPSCLATSTTCSKSRTPHNGFLDFKFVSKFLV